MEPEWNIELQNDLFFNFCNICFNECSIVKNGISEFLSTSVLRGILQSRTYIELIKSNLNTARPRCCCLLLLLDSRLS